MDLEAGVLEILCVEIVDPALKIGGAEYRRHAERMQRMDMVLAGGEHRCAVLPLPVVEQRGLRGEPPHHEGRRAFGMDEIAAVIGKKGDLLLVGVEASLEFVLGAFVEGEKDR